MVALAAPHNHDATTYTKTETDTKYWHSGNMGNGSGFDADLLDAKEATAIMGAGFPIGSVLIWKGALGDVPTGYSICNGQTVNGYQTPDLRNRFVVGAGSTYNPGDTGGATTFAPTATLSITAFQLTIAEMPSHKHTWSDTCGTVSMQSGPEYNCSGLSYRDISTGSTGGDQAHGHSSGEGTAFTATNSPVSTLPLYYSLYYIMRTS
jgi:hypothetical protein